MSAVNPLPAAGQTPGLSEKRSYEPSMEEILASIRRIIADDQSLPKHPTIDPAASSGSVDDPRHEATPTPAPFPSETAPFPDLHQVTPPADATHADHAAAPPPPVVAPDLTEAAIAPFPSPDAVSQNLTTNAPGTYEPAAYEPIAAPQFPVPHGPVGDEPTAQPHTYDEAVSASDFGHEPPHTEAATPAAAAEPPPTDEPQVPHPSMPPGEDYALYDTPIDPPKPRAPERSAASLFSESTDSSVSSAFNLLAASRLADNSDELLTLAREMIRPLLRTWLDDNLPSMVERMVRAEIERVARGGR